VRRRIRRRERGGEGRRGKERGRSYRLDSELLGAVAPTHPYKISSP
jgi:hypothetical protein